MPRSESKQSLGIEFMVALSFVGLIVGWKSFWFLTDDAYIAFRYVSNSMLGYGYVWNAPPFLPVEGYTSFLWVALLDLVWRVSGVDPPRAANFITLFFACLTFAVTALVAVKMPLRRELASSRPVLVGLVLLGCVSNRTFLAWTSSGLETAMFNFFLLCWFIVVYRAGALDNRRVFFISLAAALICLTRPDGMLYVLATVAVIAIAMYGKTREGRLGYRNFLSVLPLLLVPAHFLWRKATYGEWLPNTYTAKYLGAWPESGVRYALSFVLEYSLWIWAAVLVVYVVQVARRRLGFEKMKPARVVAVVTVVAHAGYYTLVMGGDHFEFRVYSQLVPLIFLSFLALLNAVGWTRVRSAAVFAAFVLLALPLPWTHWSSTRHLDTRAQTHKMIVPIAEKFPPPVRWYVRWFDSQQAWLIDRYACTRHQEHKAFHRHQIKRYPPRDVGAGVTRDGFPAYATFNVGVPAWTMPHVIIIDRFGLNDYVIARMPQLPSQRKLMAHGRAAPENYVGSYSPNVLILPDRIEVHGREIPLTEESVARLETEWRNWLARRDIEGQADGTGTEEGQTD
jgi:arabinofuranosyltransferase